MDEKTQKKLNSDLLYAAEGGYFSKAYEALRAGADPNCVDKDGNSALNLAVLGNHSYGKSPFSDRRRQTISILLRSKARFQKNQKNIDKIAYEFLKNGDYALLKEAHASGLPSESVISAFISVLPYHNLNFIDDSYSMIKNLRRGNEAMIEKRSDEAYLAIAKENHEFPNYSERFSYLISKGVVPSQRILKPLFEHVGGKELAAVKLLVEQGLKIKKDVSLSGPMLQALNNDDDESLKYFLEQGTINSGVPSMFDSYGEHLYGLAFNADSPNLAMTLLKNGVAVKDSKTMKSVFLQSVQHSYAEVLEFVLNEIGSEAIAELHSECDLLQNWLYGEHWRYGKQGCDSEKTLRIVLETNPENSPSYFEKGVSFAVQNGMESTLSLLLRSDFEPDMKDENGQTPLEIAVREGFPRVVKMLLEAGADPNVETSEGIDLIDSARNKQIRNILNEHMALRNAANQKKIRK